MSSPVVSILMPVFNGAAFVGQAIESAIAQTYPDFELIIVNDGSTDNSAEVIRPYLADPRIRYLEQPNGGVAAARNSAFRVAKGLYIGFLDQDDVWLPEKLALQIAYLKMSPQCAMVHARQGYIDDKGRRVESEFINVEPVEGQCFRALFDKNRIAVLTVLARRSVIEEVGGFNAHSSGGDDYELWLRIAWNYSIGFLDQVVAHYRVHSNNVSHDAFRMTVTDLAVIDSILRDLPDVRKQLRLAANRRLFELNWQLAGWYMWRSQDFMTAKQHLRRALDATPWSTKAWRRYAWCSLTANQRRTLAWWRTRIGLARRHPPVDN